MNVDLDPKHCLSLSIFPFCKAGGGGAGTYLLKENNKNYCKKVVILIRCRTFFAGSGIFVLDPDQNLVIYLVSYTRFKAKFWLYLSYAEAKHVKCFINMLKLLLYIYIMLSNMLQTNEFAVTETNTCQCHTKYGTWRMLYKLAGMFYQVRANPEADLVLEPVFLRGRILIQS
jgi:hypothetical protein